MIEGYWRNKSWKFWSNWAMGVAGSIQASVLAMKGMDVVLPASITQAAGYAAAFLTFFGIFVRGVDQTAKTADDEEEPAPEKAP